MHQPHGEILYLLAEISYFEKDYKNYEIRLLNILAEDENYKNKSKRDAMINTISGNNRKAVEKFFSLYRVDSYISLNAYIQLADLYYELGENKKALEFSALAVITSFTKINETLESRNIEYKTNSLSKFLQECSFYSDIVEWGNKNDVWKSFTQFTRISLANGYKEFSRELLRVLVKDLPDVYWQKNAVLLLENM